jgi:hypothetical protein
MHRRISLCSVRRCWRHGEHILVKMPSVRKGDVAVAAGAAYAHRRWHSCKGTYHLLRPGCSVGCWSSCDTVASGSTKYATCGGDDIFRLGGDSRWRRRRPEDDPALVSLAVFFSDYDIFIRITGAWQWRLALAVRYRWAQAQLVSLVINAHATSQHNGHQY